LEAFVVHPDLKFHGAEEHPLEHPLWASDDLAMLHAMLPMLRGRFNGGWPVFVFEVRANTGKGPHHHSLILQARLDGAPIRFRPAQYTHDVDRMLALMHGFEAGWAAANLARTRVHSVRVAGVEVLTDVGVVSLPPRDTHDLVKESVFPSSSSLTAQTPGGKRGQRD